MTTSDEPCPSAELVELHFSARITPVGERRLRHHLTACQRCRDHYERWLFVSQIDGAVASPSQRLAIGLGLRPPRSDARLPRFGGVVAATLAGAAILLAVGRHSPPRDERVMVGLDEPSVSEEFAVYRVGRGGISAALLKPDAEIAPDEPLGFAYAKAGGVKRLMIFGVGERRRVFWYQPGRGDATANPAAQPISDGELLHELSDAITHRLDEGTLRLFALFTNREDLRASDVEAAVAGASPELALRLPGCGLRSVPLHVKRRSQ
jgi:hypothetical protein